MILCYHKVSLEPLTQWWVSADVFDRQMADLQAYEVVTLDDYDPTDPDHAVITFDGPYADVATFAAPLLRKWGYPFEAFVIGDWVGRENTFDQVHEPPAWFASERELDLLVAAGGRLQWHTRTHSRLAGRTAAELDAELTVPQGMRDRYGDPHFTWFAYPHGESDRTVQEEVRRRYRGAVSVVEGSADDRWSMPRREAKEDTDLSRSTVSVVIANYEYGRYLPEAVTSVLRQSRPPDQLVIIDDGSQDQSGRVLDRYEDQALVLRNGQNRGIVPTFRRAVEHCTGDYVAFLGADNRFRSDFVERCKAALDADTGAAVAYTDVALFGPRAALLADRVGATPTLADDVFLWAFPDPTQEALADLDRVNFLHGSSMYRRADYDRCGGYRDSGGPEDHDLFRRMLSNGRRAVHVREPVLEYRQHSGEQANTLLVAQLETAWWTEQAELLRQRAESLEVALAERTWEAEHRRGEVEQLQAQVVALLARSAELDAVHAGGWWRLRLRLLPVLGRLSRLRRLRR